MSILGDAEIYEADDFLNENIQNSQGIATQISDNNDENRNNDDDGDGDGDGADNEGEEGEGTKVEAKKRTRRILNANLNADMLQGTRGIHTLENYFKDHKFHGKGYEVQDLNGIMKKLEHWSHRLFPKYGFEDNIEAIEKLGKKKVVQAHMSKYRHNLLVEHEIMEAVDNSGDEDDNVAPFDEMDALLDQQIEKSRFDHTHNASVHSRDQDFNSIMESPRPSTSRMSMYSDIRPLPDSPAPPSSSSFAERQLNADQMAIIAENRRKALQKLQERKNAQMVQSTQIEIE